VIAYYQTILYENLGIVGDRNLLVTGIYNVVGPLFNLVFIVFFLDKVGLASSVSPLVRSRGYMRRRLCRSVFVVEALPSRRVWVIGLLVQSGPRSPQLPWTR
jgi:hypothetical protein